MKNLKTFEQYNFDRNGIDNYAQEYQDIKVGQSLKGVSGYFAGITGKITRISVDSQGRHGGATFHVDMRKSGDENQPMAAIVYDRIKNGEFVVV